MLPILVPQFKPDQWRSLERQLIKIAGKEKEKLQPRDRLVDKSLALAQSYARRLQWGDLFRFLLERNIVCIAEPPPKPPKPPRPPKVCLKNRFRDLLPEILYSDRAISTYTVKARAKVLGLEMIDRLYREYLNQFEKEGTIYRTQIQLYSAYSLQPTDKLDREEWLPDKIAYRIAVVNGCQNSFYFFRNRLDADYYMQFGLEYSEEKSMWRCCDDAS